MLSRDMDTSTMEGQEALVTDYLDVVRGLIDHRFNKATATCASYATFSSRRL
jgi:hypothetical protein